MALKLRLYKGDTVQIGDQVAIVVTHKNDRSLALEINAPRDLKITFTKNEDRTGGPI